MVYKQNVGQIFTDENSESVLKGIYELVEQVSALSESEKKKIPFQNFGEMVNRQPLGHKC